MNLRSLCVPLLCLVAIAESSSLPLLSTVPHDDNLRQGYQRENLHTSLESSLLRHTQEQTQATTAISTADKQRRASQENREKFQACITACSDCIVECKSCATDCLNERDIKVMVRCIRLNQDCAAVCAMAMESMASGSEFTKRICSLCGDICYACAIECEKHTQMEHCTQCAEACRKCAIECNKMSKM